MFSSVLPSSDHRTKELKVLRAQLAVLEEERSARKKAEEEFRKINERYLWIYNSSKDAIGYCNLDGVLIDVNDSFARLTGYSKEELLSGKKYQDITPLEYREFETYIAKKVLETGESTEYEKEYIRKDGSRVSIYITVFLVKDRNNIPTGFSAIIRDLTKQKK